MSLTMICSRKLPISCAATPPTWSVLEVAVTCKVATSEWPGGNGARASSLAFGLASPLAVVAAAAITAISDN